MDNGQNCDRYVFRINYINKLLFFHIIVSFIVIKLLYVSWEKLKQ
jgi:hypothetical protein